MTVPSFLTLSSQTEGSYNRFICGSGHITFPASKNRSLFTWSRHSEVFYWSRKKLSAELQYLFDPSYCSGKWILFYKMCVEEQSKDQDWFCSPTLWW